MAWIFHLAIFDGKGWVDLIEAPFSTLLFLAGVAFFALGAIGRFPGKAEVDRVGRAAFGIVGIIFVAVAFALYIRADHIQPETTKDGPTAAACSKEAQLKSAFSTDKTEIEITNTGRGRLRVFWVKPDGERFPQSELNPAESTTLETFVGHVFVVVGPDSRCKAIVIAQSARGKFEIP